MAAPAAASGAARAGALVWLNRRSLLWLLALAVAGPLAIVLLVVVVLLSGSGADNQLGQFRPSALALRDIPRAYLSAYQAAGTRYELGWEYIAAIGKIETDHGRSMAAGVRSGVNFAGCCAGPMQFLITGPGGGTWGAYGVDGNTDGRKDVYDPQDAIPATGRYLQASGAPGDWDGAIFAYNHASWYVADVKRQARLYRGASVTAPGVLAGAGNPDADALASNPNITWAHPLPQLADLRSGRVSSRLISLLALVAQRHEMTVTALASDHYPGTNHEAGRAADIAIVDADNCYPPARSGGCWQLAQELDRLEGCLHPTELIYYFDPGPSPDSFAERDHDDHVHVGYDGPLGPTHYNAGVDACSNSALTGSRG